MTPGRGAVVVTGTDTGVGKTIVTAAIAAAHPGRVAVLKPAQTGDDDDAGTVARLAGVTTKALAHFPDPLAPLTAARTAGLAPLALDPVVATARELADDHDLVLIEGAGGLLVPLGAAADGRPWTVADLAVRLGAPAMVVVRAGLGTLNHTALTLEALRRRGVAAQLVIGAWPTEPELVHHTNRQDLAALGPVAGVVPAGAGVLPPDEFRRAAPSWFTRTQRT